jgi:uncharacterized alpha/beta hydrolase family protein
MKKYANKIAILLVFILFGYVGWTFLTTPERAKKHNAAKVADYFQYLLKQKPDFREIKVYPNKPKIGSILIQGSVKDDNTMNTLRTIIDSKKDIEPVIYKITINSEPINSADASTRR